MFLSFSLKNKINTTTKAITNKPINIYNTLLLEFLLFIGLKLFLFEINIE